MAVLKISLLGPMEARLDRQPVAEIYANSKVQALLAYLAVERKRPQRREALMAILWPGMPEKSARHNLSQTLYMLRNIFPEVDSVEGRGRVPLVLADRRGVQLNPEAAVEVDVHRLEELLQDPAGVEEAGALYRGDFLSDFYLDDSSEFEGWAAALREAYRGELLEGLSTRADASLQGVDFEQARAFAERQLMLDPLRERAHRQLMESLAREGDRAKALQQYQVLEELLESELGAAPSQESRLLYERIRTEQDVFAEPAPVEETRPRPGHNLASQPTAFVGRQEELRVVAAMLAEPGIRLVSLVGPGGTGKTRLAMRAALDLVDGYPDGAWFVGLAPLQQAEEVVPAIARAMDFSFYREQEQPERQLLSYLREKRMLLVLDNFEHLLEAAPLVAEILGQAPGVNLLVTSRVRLNLQGEQLYTLLGMRAPQPSDLEECDDPVKRVRAFSAVQLFLERARRVRHDFKLTAENVPAVMEVCRLVQGLPLGIELAAAWLALLPVEEIAAEIARSLDFLESDLADLPPRQRSLRAVYESSWKLLDEEEREAYLHLCVFVGSFSRQAAQEVGGTTLRTLLGLVNKSWLQQVEGGRFQLHELMRQYGVLRLKENEAAWREAKERHSDYFARFVVKQSERMKGPEQVAGLDALEEEFDSNLKSAWEWLVSEKRCRTLIDNFLLGMYQFGMVRGHFGDLIPWLRRARASLDPEAGSDERLAFVIVSALEVYCEEFMAITDASPMLRLAAVWQEVVENDLEKEMGFWFALMAGLAVSKKVDPHAGMLLNEAVERLRSQPDTWKLGHALLQAGKLWSAFSIDAEKITEAAKIFESLGVLYEQGVASEMLGRNAIYNRQPLEEVTRYMRRAQEYFSKVGERYFLVSIAENLASAYFKQGLVAEGFAIYAREKPIIEQLGNNRMLAEILHWESLDALRYSSLEHALETRLRCLELTVNMNIQSDTYWRSFELGEVYRVAGENEKALGLFEEANTGFEAIDNALGMGYVQRAYGDIALKAARYADALSHYRAYNRLSQRDNPDWSIAQSHAKLALANAYLEEREAARSELRKCLVLTSELNHQELDLIALLAEPVCLIQEGALKRAVELAALIRHHPTSWNETRAQADEIIKAASGELSERTVRAAEERGRQLELKLVAAELLGGQT